MSESPIGQSMDQLSPRSVTPFMQFRRHRAEGLATAVCALLIMNILFDVISIVSNEMQIDLLKRAHAQAAVTIQEAEANDARQQTIGVVQTVLYIVTAIVFLIWLNRSYKVLIELGTPSTRFSPGWAVGYWFIPFINLWRPYQIVKELWCRSAEFHVSPIKAPIAIGVWWVAWIALNVSGRAVLSATLRAESIEEHMEATNLSTYSACLSIGAGALALWITNSINQLQKRAIRTIQV